MLPGGAVPEEDPLVPDGVMVPMPNTWQWERTPLKPGHYQRSCCKTTDNERIHTPACRWWCTPPDNPGPLPVSGGDVRKVLGLDRSAMPEPKKTMPKALVSVPNVPTPEADLIVNHLLAQWLDLFLEKNSKYKAVRQLGARGVFPDVNRKVGILEARVWNGENVPGESTERVIMDLIGHLFLMWANLERGDDGAV